MAYCTRQDLVARIGETLLQDVSDLENLGRVNEDRVTRACVDASAEIDGYALARYPVPFNPVPPVIRSAAVEIAIYRLFVARGHDQAGPDGVWAVAYKNLVRMLERLSRGEFTIGASLPVRDQAAIVVAPPAVFGREKLEGF